MKVKIYALDHSGRGIAKIDNKVVFIANALVDEEVEIRIVEDKKKFMIGEVLSYITKSDKRVEPACKYYDLCGGCDIMHMSYADQLTFKQNKVKDIMVKYGNIDSALINDIVGTDEFNYRNKITLQVRQVLGFYKKNSYEVVNIDACLISDPKIEAIITKLNTLDLSNIKQIVIRQSKNYDETMLVIDAVDIINKEIFKEAFKDLNIVLKNHNDYQLVQGKDHIMEKLGDYDFIISADSFFQVNTNGAKALYDEVVKFIDINNKYNIMDLYCGTGSIGIYLSKYAKQVLGVESNQYAIKDAKENAKTNGISNINFKCSDVGVALNTITFIPDLVVIDPPRAGLNSLAITQIVKINAQDLIYVSCDPMTLARDLKILSDIYQVIKITPVDMFPNTNHVECVVLMSRKDK